MSAVKGFRKLDEKEVKEMYGDPPKYADLKWPDCNRVLDSNSKQNTWTFSGYFDCCKIPVVC
jgi:hypothetical protein